MDGLREREGGVVGREGLGMGWRLAPLINGCCSTTLHQVSNTVVGQLTEYVDKALFWVFRDVNTLGADI